MREGKAAKYLGAELENIVLHDRKITLAPWPDGLGYEYESPDYDDSERSQGTGGSNNWPIEALGCRYSIRYIARGWSRDKEATEFFAKARLIWGGSELDSLIYEYMQAHAVLEICHVAGLEGQTDIRNAAIAWLRYAAARCEMFRSPRTKRILTVGDRSAGVFDRGSKCWQDSFADIGMGRDRAPNEVILSARQSLVREAFEPLRHGYYKTPVEALLASGVRTWQPVRVVEWANGKAVWRNGDGWNGNTQPVAVAWEENGVTRYAPENRGYIGGDDRTHRRPGRPTVTEGPTTIDYDSQVYDSLVFALPPRSQRTLDVEIGGPEIVKDLLTTKPPVDPPKPGTSPKPLPRKRKRWGFS